MFDLPWPQALPLDSPAADSVVAQVSGAVKGAGPAVVAGVQKRYEAVSASAKELQDKLAAAVDAGKLTPSQTAAVDASLTTDITTAGAINSQLLSGLSGCFAYISSPWLLDACQVNAAVAVMGQVRQLELDHQQHALAAKMLLP